MIAQKIMPSYSLGVSDQKMTQLDNNTDLDNLKEEKRYFANLQWTTITNLPSGTSTGAIIVDNTIYKMPTDGTLLMVKQTLLSGYGRNYERLCYGGTWTVWHTIYS